jgi:uridylate kinase
MLIQQLVLLHTMGVQLAIVIGGGNIFRGRDARELSAVGLSKITADYMGMMATVMNGVAVRDFLQHHGIDVKVYSSLAIANVVKGYNRESAYKHLCAGNMVIFVAGVYY